MMSTTKRHPAAMRGDDRLRRRGHASTGMDLRRRLQHRRLCLLGADRRQPRAGACLRPLSRAELPRDRPRRSTPTGRRRRLPRLRRAAGGDRAGDADDELAGKLGIDRLEFRHQQRAARRRHTVTGQMLEAGVGIAACLEALRPHWQRALAEAAAFNAGERSHAPRRRHRLHVVRLRQHLAAQSLDASGRPRARRHASRCIRARSISARARTRS